MEILELLNIVNKHRKMIFLLCLCAAIVTFFLTHFLFGEKYEAKAIILIKPPNQNVKIAASKEDKELLNFPVSGGKLESASNTYIEVIKSRALAERVVRQLGLDAEKPEVQPKTYLEKLLFSLRERVVRGIQILRFGRYIGKPSALENAVLEFQDNISLESISDSYLIEIQYTADRPEMPAKVVNATVELFVQYMAAIDSPEAKSNLLFIDKRLRRSHKDFLAARERLREFKQKNLTLSFKEEATEKIKLIASLENDLEKIEINLAGLLNQLMPSNPKVQVLQAEKDRLLSILAQRKRKMEQLPELEKQLAELSLNVKTSEEVYELIKKEHEEARLRAGRATSEIKVISSAIPPTFPIGRAKSLYIGGSLFMSLLIGLGLAFFLEYRHTELEKIEDVERSLQLPVLATLPRMGHSSIRS